jgi:hypothetical protein
MSLRSTRSGIRLRSRDTALKGDFAALRFLCPVRGAVSMSPPPHLAGKRIEVRFDPLEETNFNGYDIISSAAGDRQIRFALKFTY